MAKTTLPPIVNPPLVSAVLTTRDRPGFLSVALRCFAHQTYPNRELIVVDDGDRHPVDEAAVAAVGGRLVRATPGTPIGTKLNLGLEQAKGELCQKQDDDDWYAPNYIESFVRKLHESWRVACRPTVAFVTPFLFFDVARWEVRQSADGNVPGATLFFRYMDWRESPFRNLPGDEDLWFYQDQLGLSTTPLPMRDTELFMAVRHRGSRSNRGHTWVNQWNNVALEDYLLDRPLYKRPEKLLPKWAVEFYRELRDELRARNADEPAEQ
jgi:glycosyltransferase involved in cell wall biosynthesis